MMGTNSEARKALERPMEPFGVSDQAMQRNVALTNRRREVLRDALAEVWSGADFTDADAVLDHLTDRGVTLEVQA